MAIAICDDITTQLDIIEGAINSCPTWSGKQPRIDRYTSGRSLLDAVKKGVKYSFIFLDIHMPEISGLDIYSSLDNCDTAIVFVSTHTQLLPETHALRAQGFLAKPYSQDTFDRTVRSVLEQTSKSRYFTFADGAKKKTIPYRDIYYFSVEGHYTFIYTVRKKETLYGRPLRSLESELSACCFFRCNKNSLVNLKHCEGRKDNRIVFKTSAVDASLLISKRKLREFDEQLLLSIWR